MHYSTRRHVALGLTTGGLLMTGLGMTTAHADTGASASGEAAGSPGVGSGNLLQIPVNLPVDVCGNQVNVVGILDSVTGNRCANGESQGADAAGSGASGSSASGSSHGSPGVGSGNLIQIPVNAPVNICGNQLAIVGIGDSVHGTSCANRGGSAPASASGSGSHSPGIGAGNVVQVPVNVPVNICGNQLTVVGILDSVTGNRCANGGSTGSGGTHLPPPTVPGSATPPGETTPPSTPPTSPTGPCPSGGSSTPPAHHHQHGPSTSQIGGGIGATSGGSGTSGNSGGAAGSGSHGSAGSHESGGLLAHTGTGALAFAPFGAGLLSGGVLLKRRLPMRRH
jgi:hypothetical protein